MYTDAISKEASFHKTSSGWQGQSRFVLPDNYELHLTTRKARSGLVCEARVVRLERGFEVHRMFKDFNRIMAYSDLKCTESNVMRLHHGCLDTHIQTLLKDAQEHNASLT